MKSNILCMFLQFITFLAFSACNVEPNEESPAPALQSEVSDPEDEAENLLEKNRNEFLEYESALESYTTASFNYEDYEFSYSYTNSDGTDVKSWKIYLKVKGGDIPEEQKIIDENNMEVFGNITGTMEVLPNTMAELFNRFHYKWFHGLNDEYTPYYCELFYKNFDDMRIPYKFVYYSPNCYGKNENYIKIEILDFRIIK